MTTKNPEVDVYLSVGCGRCKLVGTPECKVNFWQEPLKSLRRIVLETGLTEERKWGVPCYTLNGSNIVMVSAYKDSAVLSFLKGALLEDPDSVLLKPGESSQSARVLRFTETEQVDAMEPTVKAFIAEAIDAEKAGKKVTFKKNIEPIPEELTSKFIEDTAFKAAFQALTPGRQRGYLLYFNGAKQSSTRSSRIEKVTPQIFAGKGMHD